MFFAAVHDSLHHGGSPTAIVIENVASGAEVFGPKAAETLASSATRAFGAASEPVGAHVSQQTGSIRKSTTPRRFGQAAEQALADIVPTDLSGLELAVLMVDGVQFADHQCIVALGITVDGTKVPLAIEDGSAEDAAPVGRLIAGIGKRGLDITLPILAVLGSDALCRAVRDVFDHPVIARCQLRVIGEVKAQLPEDLQPMAEERMRQAYCADTGWAAQALLQSLAADLEQAHPEAAARLREGLPEALTVLRLGISPTLTRTLANTAAITSMIEISRERTRDVKKRSAGRRTPRGADASGFGTGMALRRLNGYRDLPDLCAALEDEARNAAQPVITTDHLKPDTVTAALGMPRDPGHPPLPEHREERVHCTG
jgi:hypothetical protein